MSCRNGKRFVVRTGRERAFAACLDGRGYGRRDSLLLAVHLSGETIRIAALDLGSWRFRVLEVVGGEGLAAEIGRLRPAEVLVSEDSTLLGELSAVRGLSCRPAWHFDAERAGRTLAGHFGVADLSVFGCENLPAALNAAGCLFQYAAETQRTAAVARQSEARLSLPYSMITVPRLRAA